MIHKGNGADALTNDGFSKNRKILKRWIVCFLLAIFIGLLYFNSLGNQFTNWDDGMIYQNPSIRNLNWTGIKKLFTLVPGNTYQPVRMLSYAIDYHFWKLNPVGYHVTNIFFYILTCIMVYFTLLLLSSHLRETAPPDSHGRVALLGAFLFAAHPVHVEAVTWLAARKEVLQGFFFFSAFFLYLKGREAKGQRRVVYLGMVLLTVLLAVLSKPSSVVFPGVIAVYEIAKKREGFFRFLKTHWAFLALSIVLSGVFTGILMKVMIEAGGIKAYRGDSVLSNILVPLYAFLYNLKLLMATVNYSAAYSFSVPMPFFAPKNILLIGVTLLLFAASILSFRWTKVIFFSFFFFTVTIFPYLNIIPISTLLADRYVFIASFSFSFLVGIVFDRFYRLRNRRFSEGFFNLLSIVIFLMIMVGYSLMTIYQNKIWENSFTLWADAVEKHPESNMANALMGVSYMELGLDEKAIPYLEKAVQILPYDYQSRNNLGIVYGKLNQPDKALKEYETALLLRPEDDTIKINLSVFYIKQKEYKKAEEVLQYLLSKNDQNAHLHFRLGLLYKEAGRFEEAVSEMLKSSQLAPHIVNPYEELGNIYARGLKDLEKAKYYYTQGIEKAPKATYRVEELRWMVQDLECHR